MDTSSRRATRRSRVAVSGGSVPADCKAGIASATSGFIAPRVYLAPRLVFLSRLMLERIGRYQVVRKLGEGGMGTVYEARDESLGRAVALKVIREDNSDENAARRFRREAKTAASINHPNVCQIFESGEEHGAHFIVMELL